MKSRNQDSLLKCYPLSDGGKSGWAVSGRSKEEGKRWRRVFDTREAAEAFYRDKQVSPTPHAAIGKDAEVDCSASGIDPVGSDFEVDAVADGVQSEPSGGGRLRRSRRERTRKGRGRGSRLWLKIFGCLLLIALFALASAPLFRNWLTKPADGRMFSEDFESDPHANQWVSSGEGSSWTDREQCSGTKALAIGSGSWMSPGLRPKALQWYLLKFKAKGAEIQAEGRDGGSSECVVSFYNNAGNHLGMDLVASVPQSPRWQVNDLRFRAHAWPDGAGNVQPLTMKVSFEATGGRSYFVDDVSIEEATIAEVGQWANRSYQLLPATLTYRPKNTHWQRIPLTMQKLRQGHQIRIVVLGDEFQQDLANSPIDVFLNAMYPGPRPEVLCFSRNGTGMGRFKDSVDEFVTKWQPDLLIIGGNSNRDVMDDFQQILDEVRASDFQTGRATEMVLLSKCWSPNVTSKEGFILRPDMRELDQKVENNVEIPDDFRGHLLRFAATNRIEFLDMTGILSEFIFGPCSSAGVGPPADASGAPYSYWMRDSSRPNEYGRQIMARILEAYFAPLTSSFTK